MKFQIMLKILFLLLARRRINAKEIAERFEISTRSVYRYIEELCVADVPINITRGRYGGIYIADTFRLPAGYFTQKEYAATVNALTAMASQVHEDAVESALEKLQRQLKQERVDASVSGGIIVDGGTWGDTKNFADKMEVCEKAVKESLCLDIDYISREGKHSRRIIEPHVLIFKQNIWYIYAFCHTRQQFRLFKIARIKSARFTGKNFVPQQISREDIPLNFRHRTDELTALTLEISKDKLPDAEEWLGIDSIEPRGDKFIAEISVPDDDGLVSKILAFGGGVKILSPSSLREKVIAAAKAVTDSI